LFCRLRVRWLKAGVARSCGNPVCQSWRRKARGRQASRGRRTERWNCRRRCSAVPGTFCPSNCHQQRWEPSTKLQIIGIECSGSRRIHASIARFCIAACLERRKVGRQSACGRHELQVGELEDLTAVQSGFMVGGPANGFGQVDFNPAAANCTGSGSAMESASNASASRMGAKRYVRAKNKALLAA
jgi:hypothetical protein